MSLRRTALAVAALSLLATVACGAPADEEAGDASEGAASSANPQALLDLPFYFSVNVDAMTTMTRAERAQHPYPTLWNPAQGSSGETGLRVIAVPQGEQSKMARPLTTAGILQAGDILVSFRPGLANTLPYAHLQMGSTHAGLVRVVGGTANGVDQPLDSDHNSPNAAPFTSRHYRELPAMHVIRPRGLDARRKQNLDFWQGKAQSLIDKQGRPGFNDNYLSPATAHPQFADAPANVALAIGKGLLAGNVRGALGIDLNPNNAGEQQLFCSELVYHLLTLSNCSEADIAGATSAPSCLSGRPFEMQPFAGAESAEGLGEGPLLVAEQEPALLSRLPSVFCGPSDNCNPSSSQLSSGHRAANAMLLQYQVPQALEGIYAVRGSNPNAPLPEATLPIVKGMPKNYSPTSFVIDALKPSGQRGVDYVATIVFVDAGDYAKAKTLSKNPIPRTQ